MNLRALNIGEYVKVDYDNVLNNKKIAVTGKFVKFNNREDIILELKRVGAIYNNKVTKETDILIFSDNATKGSKYNDAKTYDTFIMSENDFYRVITKE